MLLNMLPPTQNSVELELTIQHPIAYPILLPLQGVTLPLESLLGPNSSFLPRCANQFYIFLSHSTLPAFITNGFTAQPAKDHRPKA
jgi:hypothetical protein